MCIIVIMKFVAVLVILCAFLTSIEGNKLSEGIEERMNSMFNQMKTEFKSEITNLQHENEKIKFDKEASEKEMTQLKSDVKMVQGENEKLKSDVQMVQGENEKLKSNVQMVQGENEKLKTKVVHMEENMKSIAPRNTAAPIGTFYAYMLSNTAALGGGQTIVFETVGYDSGNHYNPTNGIFIAPVSGVYVFHITFYFGGYTYLAVDFVEGSSVVMTTHGYSNTMSGSCIIHVNADEQLHARTHPGHSGRVIYGEGYSHFTGFLLHADPIE